MKINSISEITANLIMDALLLACFDVFEVDDMQDAIGWVKDEWERFCELKNIHLVEYSK